MSAARSARCVLVVDDDDTFRQVLAAELERRGYRVEVATSGREALERVGAVKPDVILLDLRLPDLSGIDVLEQLQRQGATAGVILLTGHGTIDTAIRAIRLGAHDYLEKPCPIDKMQMTIDKTCEHLSLLARQQVLQDGYSPPNVRPKLIGESPAFRKMYEAISRIACTEATTLILGETGTGKDLVAALVHNESSRSEAPFVVVDCAALHEELLQSELFGHEKGAFSGAARRKHGLFEVAHGGTLFLDEVGDTSPEVQAKLLRVLETGRFRRLGGNEEIEVDVRVVSATNRDLESAIAKQHFREDLFFRLSTLTIVVPPLRERQGDVRLLLAHFSEHFNRRFSRSCRLSEEALQLLEAYEWPGNVRELIHVLEQAIVLSERDELGPRDLPESMRQAARGSAAPARVPTLREVERQHVLATLAGLGGSRALAAEALGISERNLYRLLRRYSEHPGPGDEAAGSSAP